MKSWRGLGKDYWLFWTASIMLQTGVEKQILGRVSATLRMISIASGAAGEMLFGLLNDATWVWLPIFLGAAGVGLAAVLFKRFITDGEAPELDRPDGGKTEEGA